MNKVHLGILCKYKANTSDIGRIQKLHHLRVLMAHARNTRTTHDVVKRA